MATTRTSSPNKSSRPRRSLKINQIADIPVADLAKKYGTPLFVYDASVIRDRAASLKHFDIVRYAQKANSNLAILSLLRECGMLVDAVSAGEILRAKAAGFAFEGEIPPVVYTADVFDRDALDLIARHNIHVNVGSPDMISQLGAVNPGGSITLRINPGFGHGHSRKTNTGGSQSKHGIWHEQITDCVRLADRHSLTISGLHMHIGSGVDFDHLSQVAGAMLSAAEAIDRPLRSISAGGGIPTPYRDTDQTIDLQRYYEVWNEARLKLAEQFGHAVVLELEPGRYPVAESGFLISEIRAVKQMGENLFYLVDAGFNNLARPAMYGAWHPISVSTGDTESSDDLRPVIVGGPLCESGDIFTQAEGGVVEHRNLPAASVGDFLVIECAGAYGFTMSSNYNSKPLAAEVLIDAGQDCLIRPRQTLESLFASEIIPTKE